MDNSTIKAVQILNNGGVIIIPTDTVYGLAAVYGNVQGTRRIFEIKKRLQNKPLAVLIPDIDSIEKWIDKDPAILELCRKSWPGATTLIIEDRNGESIGLRMPDHAALIEIMKKTGPLSATSANISGQPAPLDLESIPYELKDACDMVLDLDPKPCGKPSRVLDIRNGQNNILRE